MLDFDIRKFFLGGVTVPHDREDLVRLEQVHAYIAMIPAVTLAMVIISLTLTVLNWGGVFWPVYFAFCYALFVKAFLLVRLWMGHQQKPIALKYSEASGILKRISFHAGISGVIWGLLIAFLVFDQNSLNMAIVGGLLIGLMCFGAFALSIAPHASMIYLIGISSGYFLALLAVSDPVFYWTAPVLAAFTLILQRAVAWNFGRFVEQVLNYKNLEESGEVISLLLHDFETHSADWLWEVNAQGQLSRVSMRFAEAVCRPREVVEGASFLDFFEGESAERLEELMSNERSFRDAIVPVRIAGETHWWSISARPREEHGEFAGYRGVCSDVTQERDAEARVAYMAHFDALTGVANRAHFASELEKAVDQLKSNGEEFALHCIDLDDFKGVNDVHGHPAGDELLKTVARRVNACITANDLIGRQGGDEFVVLQRKLESHEDAYLMADFIYDALLEPIQLKANRLLATGSIGSAIAPLDGDDAATLLKHADLALYSAKKSGRGCSRFFEPTMDEEARRRSQIEQELRAALRSNELELHFQPLIDVKTMETKGYESLLRWRRPNGEVIMPSEFIEIAETTGLIIPLGEWVIRTAIAEAATWPDHVTVAINLSPIQMTNPSLISTVVSALGASSLNPARIEFEITESVLLEETEVNLKTLHTLRDLGAKIALDDFGTGFSSLNYLRAFPFDKIKIDKCFVGEMEERQDCRAIIKAVMSLARELNMRTTAEGVENDVQMNMLREEGCSEFQGFLFSRAIPASELPRKNARTAVGETLAHCVVPLKKRIGNG